MKKSEIFMAFADIVCNFCEVHMENLLNGNKLQTIVDARVILIRELKKFGFSSHDIAVTSLRVYNGGMKYDVSYMPSQKDILAKSKNIERQCRIFDDQYKTSRAFREMADDVAGAIDRFFEGKGT